MTTNCACKNRNTCQDKVYCKPMLKTRISKSDSRIPKNTDNETSPLPKLSSNKDLENTLRRQQVNRTISRLQKSWGKSNCGKLTTSREMRQDLDMLKEHYVTVCEQESALRSQIALLTAEIALVETKEYHRVPLNMRKLNVDPLYIRKISKTRSQRPIERPVSVTRHLFDPKGRKRKTPLRPKNMSQENVNKPSEKQPSKSRKADGKQKESNEKSNSVSQNNLPTPTKSTQNPTKEKAKLSKPELILPKPRSKTFITELKSPSPSKGNPKEETSIVEKSNEELPEMPHFCPYCSVFCHPATVIFSSNLRPPLSYVSFSPPTVDFTEFRLPKLMHPNFATKSNTTIK